MDLEKEFYSNSFDLKFEDYSEYACIPYFGVITGDDVQHGINSTLIKPQSVAPEQDQPLRCACS